MIDNYGFCELNETVMVAIYGGGSECISRNIKVLRLELGYQRAELADMLNTSLSTIAKYETGSRIPDIDTIIQLADIFNTNVDSLIY
ncbi:helix-turn-helix domain-containing protein [Leuconostoc gelidum]|uniref:helix-turn-helix domain-containing protein n=1 Tax=Leuconostoc gelidum TaxID=1244 RepID=UPI00021920DC|nr:helix-turn-helix transcriptional regulator [Leuconostoc gelidum]AFS39478.1 XRE family transcriptional regulator [Leuconostoc gelidum JB7]MBZ5992183.1 helix-turn-helix transcriptional regulator [Leuconostoc gelidum subsp. gelidum]USP17349.1 helix-turn-helix transcriptional regulator [Leuconostoc gelidum subsp. aenigmaticum]GMA67287.1 hypothetical protein GCM10025884_09140 [Leuconostoc gelidum subsp. gelidum]